MRITEALDTLGARRYGEDWPPFCRICFEKAQPAAARKGVLRHGVKYTFGILLAVPLAAIGGTMVSSFAKIADERYITARLTFSVLALACALLIAAYGLAGIARRHGWFHRHPAAEEAQLGMWRSVTADLESRLRTGTLRGYALTLDGALHAIPPNALTPEVIHTAVCGADRNALWAALRKRLGLRNAPSGAFVLDRGDVARGIGNQASLQGFHRDEQLG